MQTAFSSNVDPVATEVQWRWYHLLPLVTAGLYMITPILTWKTPLPGAIEWVLDGLVLLMALLFVANVLLRDRIPVAFWMVLGMSAIGIAVASLEGQAAAVTAFGWWMMFRWLMVGLYVYTIPDWPTSFMRALPGLLVGILAFQAAVQALQILGGETYFDNISGTFGVHGVGSLFQFTLLVIALALGVWLVTGKWKLFITALVLSGVSSAMAENKAFVIVLPIMLLLAVLLYLVRGGQIRRLIVFSVVLTVGIVGFLWAYDEIMVNRLGVQPIDRYLDEENRDRYVNSISDRGATYELGRNAEAAYGWQLVRNDPPRLLFGMGLGARQINGPLRLRGYALSEGLYAVSSGRTLIVMLHEIGIVGMAALAFFFLVSSGVLLRATRQRPDPTQDVLRLGIVIFSALWPFLVWYKAIWIVPATSTYWIVWGIAMHYATLPETAPRQLVMQAKASGSTG